MPLFIVLFVFVSCGWEAASEAESRASKESEPAVVRPSFDSDSAYQYVAQQVAFGPRTPRSKGHAACAEYLKAELARHGCDVTEQRGEVTLYDGSCEVARNIIGVINPDATRRLMLFAHWDTRPWSDHDADAANHRHPVNGANDGASGVGVLLEIARQLQQNKPAFGVDIIFFDAEDWGAPEFFDGTPAVEHDWCLGSQYWAAHPHVDGYTAELGILLDMVGSVSPKFYYELYSMNNAPQPQSELWRRAYDLGYGSLFYSLPGGAIVDDHLYVMKGRGFPCVDIIDFDPNAPMSGFAHYWHTVNDTMENVSRTTLGAVGEILLSFIYDY